MCKPWSSKRAAFEPEAQRLRRVAEAMAQWQRVGFQTQRLGVRIPLASHPNFFFITRARVKNFLRKKNAVAETGNRTQAAAATTRSPATRLFRLGMWRIRVSIPVLNLAKVVCYHVQQSPMRPSGLEPES